MDGSRRPGDDGQSPVAGRLIAARGPRAALITGSAVITAGYLLAQGLLGTPWGLLIVTAVISTGVGLAYAAMPTLIMTSAPASEGAAANGLNTLMRSIGTSTASAVIGVVLANMTISFGASTVPSLTGMRVGFLIGAGAALAACLLALAIPGRAARPAGAVVPDQHPTSTAAARSGAGASVS